MQKKCTFCCTNCAMYSCLQAISSTVVSIALNMEQTNAAQMPIASDVTSCHSEYPIMCLQLPDGNEIQIGPDRFKVPEVLFNPVSLPPTLCRAV